MGFLYKMIKVILIVVHCPTQENLEVIFHPATLMLQPETLHRKLLFSDSLKSVSVSCSSKLCKVIIHHWALWPWDISGITTTTQTTFNTCSDWLAARCQYGWVEIWIQVGCEYGCDHSSDYGGNTEMELGIDWWIHGEIKRTKLYSCKIFWCSELWWQIWLYMKTAWVAI